MLALFNLIEQIDMNKLTGEHGYDFQNNRRLHEARALLPEQVNLGSNVAESQPPQAEDQ
jgi:hypothetical protein